MNGRLSRRAFVQSTTAAAASLACFSELPARASRSANEKLNIAIIGVHGRGRANTNGVKEENIVALCDIDDRHVAAGKEQFPRARGFADWRRVMEEPSIDAVVISTADQVHAPASVMAMKMGKHVYCEKPLAHSPYEARRVRETFAESGVATQMGTQIHATDNYRRVVELVQSGAIGAVREAHVWCCRTINPLGALAGSPAVPAHLHWDLWLGPAPDRTYHPDYLPGNLNWNRRWDFGNGVLGDMGSHLIDLPFWALNLKHPTRVAAEGPSPDPVANPPWMVVTWEHPSGTYPDGSAREGVTLKWYHGERFPEPPPGVTLNRDTWFNGILFVGDDGWLLADYGRRLLLPEDKFRDFQAPEPSIPPSLGHYNEWIHAAKTGEPTLCNFEYSGALIEHNLLGNAAFRAAEPFGWDAEKFQVTGSGRAEEFLHREYRPGWII